MRIKEVLEKLEERQMPVAKEDMTIEEVVAELLRHPRCRVVHVVDGQGRLVGVISLGDLTRNVFAASFEPRMHNRALIARITAEKASHIMNRKPLYASQDDEIEEVLKRMVNANVKEIAVVDDQMRPVGDLTMVDLLRHYR